MSSTHTTATKTLKRHFLIPMCCVFLLAACVENPEIKSARASLELAEMKGDLDGMFLSLRQLVELGDEAAANSLPLVRTAIAERERMLQSLADHDHEGAIQAAEELLNIVPKHKEGLKVLRESGQIFFYLREAKHLVVSIFDQSNSQAVTIEPLMVDESLPEEQRHAFIVTTIQTLLEELGYYHGEVDGVAGPDTENALEAFQKEQNEEETFDLSVETANMLKSEHRKREMEDKDIEKRFYAFSRSRKLVDLAKKLDPNFPNAIEFGEIIDRGHSSLVYIEAQRIIAKGALMMVKAEMVHSLISSTLGIAASSPYGSVQDTWRRISPLVDEIRQPLKMDKEKLDNGLALLSTYESGRSLEFVSNLKEYVVTVHVATMAFLEPSGSLVDFRQAASDATSEYSRVSARLNGSMPSETQIQEDYEGLAAILSNHAVVSDPRTDQIIARHEGLYTL